MNLNILCFLNNNNRSELCGNFQIVDLVCSFRVFIKENKVLKNTSYENCITSEWLEYDLYFTDII